jgi:hypothetical protein
MSQTNALQLGVKFARASGAAMAKVAAVTEALRKEAEAEAPKVQHAITVLKEAGLLEEGEIKHAQQTLSTNAGTLDVLVNVANRLQTKEAEHRKALQKQANTQLGAPEGGQVSDAREKRASAVTGYRRGDDDAADAATLAMARRLGLDIGQ